MQRKQVLHGKLTRWSGLISFVGVLCGMIGSVQPSYSQTTKHRPLDLAIEEQIHSQAQEAFLQHLISSTLTQNIPDRHTPIATPGPTGAADKQEQAKPVASQSTTRFPAQDLTTATSKMILALAGILVLLGIGGYLIRRYLLKPSLFGQREHVLRVLARVNLTPKAAVALLQVPGKLLVVGATGSTLIALGEVSATALEHPEPHSESSSPSFATTLREHTQTLHEPDPSEDPLMHMPEQIQRKVSQLKQL